MPPIIVTPDRFLDYGLGRVGFSERQLQVARVTKLERFRSYFGINPNVCAEIFVGLQTTAVNDARIESREISMKFLLLALYFLKCYPTEALLTGTFGMSEKSSRKWVKFYVVKIQALKVEKVCN
jgi:hypothetical protein